MRSRPPPRRRPSGRNLNLAAGLVASLIFTPGAPARAATWLVNGSSASAADAHASGSAARPYGSIAAAVEAHGGPGDTIVVEPGVYREQITIHGSGAAGAPLVLRAATAGVVVDGGDDFSDPARWVP